MWLATDVRTGFRIPATPDAQAKCPICRQPVIPKCGEVIAWHFAHRGDDGDCDHFGEGETAWHLGWKRLAPQENVEVVVENHRADIVSPSGRVVVELQHSPISVNMIREREAFYTSRFKYLVWLVDVQDVAKNIHRKEPNEYGEMLCSWRWAKKSYVKAESPIFLDLGPDKSLLRIKRWLPRKAGQFGEMMPYAFIGTWYPRAKFIDVFLTGDEELAAAA